MKDYKQLYYLQVVSVFSFSIRTIIDLLLTAYLLLYLLTYLLNNYVTAIVKE